MKIKAAAALLLLALAASAAAQEKSQPPLITVTGQAEVRVAPDEVVFDLEVEKLDKDLSAAREQTDESVEVTSARRPEKGVDHLTLTIEIGVGSR